MIATTDYVTIFYTCSASGNFLPNFVNVWGIINCYKMWHWSLFLCKDFLVTFLLTGTGIVQRTTVPSLFSSKISSGEPPDVTDEATGATPVPSVGGLSAGEKSFCH